MWKKVVKEIIVIVVIGCIIFLGIPIGGITLYRVINKVKNINNPVAVPSSFDDNETLESSTSPNGTYTITCYLDYGSLTVMGKARAELKINSSDKEPINIFYNEKCTGVKVYWIDDNTVYLNEIKIELPDGYYNSGDDESKDLFGNYIDEYMDIDGNYVESKICEKRFFERDLLLMEESY